VNPAGRAAFAGDGLPDLEAARRLFVSWNDALRAAGLDPAKFCNQRDGALQQGAYSPEGLCIERFPCKKT
jgi:hypothetical protein